MYAQKWSKFVKPRHGSGKDLTLPNCLAKHNANYSHGKGYPLEEMLRNFEIYVREVEGTNSQGVRESSKTVVSQSSADMVSQGHEKVMWFSVGTSRRLQDFQSPFEKLT